MATNRPAPVYLKGYWPCIRCGIVRQARGKGKTGFCIDCKRYAATCDEEKEAR